MPDPICVELGDRQADGRERLLSALNIRPLGRLPYEAFARRWNRADSVLYDEQAFRDDANRVLRMVHERMQRENRDFYPRIEAA